jgi:hypothetical protein
MPTDDTREAREWFEQWLITVRYLSPPSLLRNADGSYEWMQIQDDWETWQAAWAARDAATTGGDDDGK